MSIVEVKTADTYRDDGYIQARLMDPKMGVIDPGVSAKPVEISMKNVLVTLDILH